MLNKQQYIRLSIALLIPLLILGWWLAEIEYIFPSHHIIFCEEFESHINCNSIIAKENEVDEQLHRNGAVTLWGARLTNGFHHSVAMLGDSILTAVNGKPVRVQPSTSGLKTTINLPPKPISDNFFWFCEIGKHENSSNNWFYSCPGGNASGGSFQFLEEATKLKFNNAMLLIEKHKKENKKDEISTLSISTITPLLIYIFLSIIFFLLLKTVKYVIHGHHRDTA